MPDAKFEPIELKELQDSGVLMVANEQFFWPLGLALTWSIDPETKEVSGLHVRQWTFGDGHRETIAGDGAPIESLRHEAFAAWCLRRIDALLGDEREGAYAIFLRMRGE